MAATVDAAAAAGRPGALPAGPGPTGDRGNPAAQESTARALGEPSPMSDRGAWFVGVLALVAWALVLYRPWRPVPLPVRDFASYLQSYLASHSALAITRTQLAQYASEGRFTPMTLALVAVNLSAFGWNTIGWQVMKFVCMLAAALGTGLLLRRIGAGVLGVVVGTALMICGGPAATAWLMPVVWDAVAVCAVLVATGLAWRLGRARRPRVVSVAIGLLLSFAALFAEPFVAVVPFVLAVAACVREDGSFGRPRASRRVVECVLITGMVLSVLVGVPAILVRSMASATGYATRYNPTAVTWTQASNALRATFLPFTRVLLFPANVLLVVTVVAAAWLLARRARRDVDAWSKLAIAALLPLATAAIYMPWPAFPGYYAYKALPGLALLVGASLTLVQRFGGTVARGMAVVTACAVILYGSLLTRDGEEAYRAEMTLEATLAGVLAERSGSADVVLAVDDPRLSGRLGAALSLYAGARGLPTFRAEDDQACSAARDAIAERSATIVALPGACVGLDGTAPGPSLLVSTRYVHREWKALRPRQDSLTARVWLARRK